MIRRLLFILGAGALGTLARYGLSSAMQRYAGSGFPWGTVAVNVAGCFLAGMLWVLAEYRAVFTGDVRAAVFIGFMGAFTTFSTYMLETGNLLRDGEWGYAAANVLLQIALGITALFAGMFAARALTGT